MAHIHPTAIVGTGARLADTVTVGPFTTIEDDVIVGAHSSIGPHCRIDNGARIGEHVSIHQGAVIATAPQDLKYAGEKTECHIGDHTTIREYCTVNRGTTYSYRTSVGKNCFLMAYAHVAHDCQVGDHVILANAVQLGGHVVIGERAIIGGLSAIHQFVHVGPHVMVQGTVGVGKDVPPYSLAGRHPARFEGLNVIGLRRRGFTPETILALEHVYHVLYFSSLNVSQALAQLKQEDSPIPEVRAVVHFVEHSARGIVSAWRNRGGAK